MQELAVLVEACWHSNPEKRPPFTEVVSTLGSILKRLPASVSAEPLLRSVDLPTLATERNSSNDAIANDLNLQTLQTAMDSLHEDMVRAGV